MGGLIAIASRLFGGAAVRTVGRVGLGGPGRRALAGTAAALGGERLFFGGGGGDDGGARRRRRRKMFTDTDLAQFAAAEGIAGRKAAATLMMIRAAKA